MTRSPARQAWVPARIAAALLAEHDFDAEKRERLGELA